MAPAAAFSFSSLADFDVNLLRDLLDLAKIVLNLSSFGNQFCCFSTSFFSPLSEFSSSLYDIAVHDSRVEEQTPWPK